VLRLAPARPTGKRYDGATMNVLVSFLNGHRDAVDELAQGDRVSIEQLIDVTAGYQFPFEFNRDVVFTLTQEHPLGYLLPDAYLPVIAPEFWRGQVASAADSSPENPGIIDEWVTYVAGNDSPTGISLPDDNDRARFRVSLFVRKDESVQRLGVDYADRAVVGLSTGRNDGCSLPDWGECNHHECQGDCELKRIEVDGEGLVCRCPHSW
jgi:hypothetical protein